MDKYQEEFREILTHSSLVDMGTGDGWFIWNNKRGGDHLVASRLDRFLVTDNIDRGLGDIWENVIHDAGSDQWPVCLNWEVRNSFLPKPFHFEQFWLEHKEFKGLVE